MSVQSTVVAHRLLLATLTSATLAAGVWAFHRSVSADGVIGADWVALPLFAVLFGWIAFSFWTATLGFASLLWQRLTGRDPFGRCCGPAGDGPLEARHAVLMPVYNESPAGVFAGVRAMLESLHRTGQGGAFDFFILSDTTDPDVWIEEERAWATLIDTWDGDSRVYYRHRPMNASRKAGNIADFCRRWGDEYECMLVLDADSVMGGATVAEMARRMEANPRVGLLQVSPRPVGRDSLLARLQQFSAAVYGPVFLRGFHLWAGEDSNYWGHNAIIRLKPFMDHCELPVLPGAAPLGGEILSHDFVEAALLRRGGWKVCLAEDLIESFEESPTTLTDFAVRDQRWCQGNMQHARLLGGEGLHASNRLHMAMGVMSYVASPMWLLFLMAAPLATVFDAELSDGSAALKLFAASMGMLLLPKAYGVAATLLDRGRSRWLGGGLRVAAGAVFETALSVLIAPVMMAYHSRFVVTTLTGRSVQWNAQARCERTVSWREAWDGSGWITVCGVALTALTAALVPGLLLWLSPVLAGLVLAVPMAKLLGSVAVGRRLQDAKLLLIPEEVRPPRVLSLRDSLTLSMPEPEPAAEPADSPSEVFDRLLRDPGLFALHESILRSTDGDRPLTAQERRDVLEADAARLPKPVRRAVQGDLLLLRELHVRRTLEA